MTRSIFIFIILLVSATNSWADPIGTWEITMEGPMGPMVNHLTIREEGGLHFASMATPQGEAEIGEIQVDGDHVEFSFSRAMGPRTMTMSYVCDVDGDTMIGKAISPRGELPFTGTRQ